jgi:hypothetical protein
MTGLAAYLDGESYSELRTGTDADAPDRRCTFTRSTLMFCAARYSPTQ